MKSICETVWNYLCARIYNFKLENNNLKCFLCACFLVSYYHETFRFLQAEAFPNVVVQVLHVWALILQNAEHLVDVVEHF